MSRISDIPTLSNSCTPRIRRGWRTTGPTGLHVLSRLDSCGTALRSSFVRQSLRRRYMRYERRDRGRCGARVPRCSGEINPRRRARRVRGPGPTPVQADGANHDRAELGALLRLWRRQVPDLLAPTGRLHFRLSGPQVAAFLISATILDSSSDVSFVSAQYVGHIAPSSRLALSLKPSVALARFEL